MSSCSSVNKKSRKRILGKGSYGIVRKFTNKDGNVYAQKIIFFHKDYGCENPLEINIMCSIKHQHLIEGKNVEIVDYKNKKCYSVMMELAEHGDLFDYVRDNENITYDMRINIIKEIVNALNFLHNFNILHLDIKPENVMIFKDDNKNGIISRLGDFGLSMLSHVENINGNKILYRESGNIRISKIYRPPELLEESKGQIYTDKADVWSLALTILYTLSGILPFDEDTQDEFIKKEYKRKKILKTLLKKYKNESNFKPFLNLLLQMLNNNPDLRPNMDQIINSDVFKNFEYCKEGRMIIPKIGHYNTNIPKLDITLDIDIIKFIVKFCYDMDYYVEILYLALDLYYQIIAVDISRKSEDLKITAISCLWLALKNIDNGSDINIKQFDKFCPRNKLVEKSLIFEREQEIVTKLRGITYRYNLFRSIDTEEDLIKSFEILISIPRYIENDKKWDINFFNRSLSRLKCQEFLPKTNYWKNI